MEEKTRNSLVSWSMALSIAGAVGAVSFLSWIIVSETEVKDPISKVEAQYGTTQYGTLRNYYCVSQKVGNGKYEVRVVFEKDKYYDLWYVENGKANLVRRYS